MNERDEHADHVEDLDVGSDESEDVTGGSLNFTHGGLPAVQRGELPAVQRGQKVHPGGVNQGFTGGV